MQVWLVVGFALFYSSFVFCDCNCKLKQNVVGLTNEHISNLFNLTSPYLAVLRIFHLQILGDMVLMVHAKNKTVQKKSIFWLIKVKKSLATGNENMSSRKS